MSAFAWLPSYSARKQSKPRVRVARFGDGYEQRIGDGINTLQRVWQLQFGNRLLAEIAAIEAFLEARAGVEAFDWTAPDGRAGRYVCDEWSRDDSQPVYSSLTATFREVAQ